MALCAACAEPPTKEINQAQGAIEAARAAGADVFAPEDFQAAVAALSRAHAAVEQRDYRQALNQALDSKERAREAARAGAERMAQLRSQAGQTLEAATMALQNADKRLSGADGKPAGPSSEALKTALDGARTSLQEARAAFEKQQYQAAISTAEAAQARIREALTTVADTARPPRRPAPRR